MEASLSGVRQDKGPSSLSACRSLLSQQLLKRAEGKDFFMALVKNQPQALTFTNALILQSIALDAECLPLRQRLAARLRQELEPHGSANYRLRSIPTPAASPYPDDLDDTFCVLAGLWHHDQASLDGHLLGQATLALTAAEVEPGGPYKTWLVGPDAAPAWKDVDAVVNANVAYFLSLNGIRLPKLDDYLKHQLGLPVSPYYPSPLHVLYFMSRALAKTASHDDVAAALLVTQPENVLERAMLASSLLRLGKTEAAQAALHDLLQDLEAGRGFEHLPICVDTQTGDQKHFATCPELTAAFCLEALLLAEQVQTASTTETAKDTSGHILRLAQTKLASDDSELQAFTTNVFERLTKIPKLHELTNLPKMFAEAWGPRAQNIPPSTLEQLCIAHLLGWAAYTLYDDVIDGDGTAASVCVANLASRQMTSIFGGLPLDQAFRAFAMDTFDGMDKANAWEALHTRMPLKHLPDYGSIDHVAGRSAGIMVAPVAVLRLAGYEQAAPEVIAVQTFFKHYLAAKQLNDDAHDWQKDLAKGQATSVVTKILSAFGREYRPADLEDAQKLFWDKIILEVCADIEKHVTTARQALANFGPLAQPQFFTNLLDPLEAAARKALEERMRSLEFLAAFTGPA
jgi:hypothetical protein